MDPTAFSDRLSDRLLEFAWDEWAQMGISTAPSRKSHWAQDPEALIVFTLQIARADPRLFDELLDWMLINEDLLSIRRLRAVCVDDTDRMLVAGAIAWLARRRPRARLHTDGHLTPPGDLEPLFADMATSREIDPDFAAAGLLRPSTEPSGKSQAPNLLLPITLGLRLRDILGVSIRAEVVRVLLCTDVPRMNAAALARASAYSKRNVHDALADLAAADAISVFTVGGEQRYAIDKSKWAALLGLAADGLPSHREWPQLLGVLRTILRWSEQSALADASEYMQASGARQLLERLRAELAFAGIATNLPAAAEDAPPALEQVIETIAATLELAPPRTNRAHDRYAT